MPKRIQKADSAELPKRKCPECGRTFYRPDIPVCPRCMDRMNRIVLTKAKGGGKRITHYRTRHAAAHSHRDEDILQEIGQGTATPAFLYRIAWAKAKGRCANPACRRKRNTLRVIPNHRKDGIRCLICQECYNAEFHKKKRKRGEKVVNHRNMAQKIWAQSDTLMRMFLVQNDEFVAKLRENS